MGNDLNCCDPERTALGGKSADNKKPKTGLTDEFKPLQRMKPPKTAYEFADKETPNPIAMKSLAEIDNQLYLEFVDGDQE